MPVPNTLTRIISKECKVVKYDFSKTQNAITKAIIDVEGISSWESKERSLKYAELAKERIYRNFYDLSWQIEFFSKVILSFDDEEREIRLNREEFAPRLTSLLLLHFLNREKIEKLCDKHKEKLYTFVQSKFKETLIDEKMLNSASSIFSEKIFVKDQAGITDEDHYPSRDFLQDMVEQVLKEIGEITIAEGFMIFREGKIKIKNGEITESQFTNNGIHHDRVKDTLLWNIQHECDSIFSLNNWVMGRNGKSFKDLMRLSDERFYNDIANVVKKITSRGKEIKVVIIAGPSCSNKTTTTHVIGKELAKTGLKLKELNIDDYFFNLSQHPKDEFGDYDYEMPEAIDIKLLNENLRDLVDGKVIQRPKYDFKTGTRSGYVDFSIEDDEIILIDCLHGLFQKLTASIPPSKKFKIYTESSNMVRSVDGAYTMWTDVRLQKRMIRDSKYRNYEVTRSLEHWAYVRKGELKHIIPYIFSVDAVLNSGLPYELPILKSVLKKDMPTDEYLKNLRAQGRLDAYIRAVRLKTLFDTVIEYDNIDDVSPYSPIREFIGGSAYTLAHNE